VSFLDKLAERRSRTGGALCVGLDPDVEKMPPSIVSLPQPLYEFCRTIVKAVAPYTCAFKPNLAFFESAGSAGIAQLERLLADVPSDIPVILDAKRGDRFSPIPEESRLYSA
jgi:orotidine-5'-phosphate decarboxylase